MNRLLGWLDGAIGSADQPISRPIACGYHRRRSAAAADRSGAEDAEGRPAAVGLGLGMGWGREAGVFDEMPKRVRWW
jgi:hypothetical protein